MRTNKNVTHEILREVKVNEVIIMIGDQSGDIFGALGYLPSLGTLIDMSIDGGELTMQFEVPS